jgi:ABC-type multidrug transport system fused ATPase/permease subunit
MPFSLEPASLAAGAPGSNAEACGIMVTGLGPPVFRTCGPTKVYRSGDVEVHALRGIDFEAAAGEFVVMLGPSGSGKSIFLNIIGGNGPYPLIHLGEEMEF